MLDNVNKLQHFPMHVCPTYRAPHLVAWDRIHDQSLLVMSPVTRSATTWPLELELKVFLSNNVHMSMSTEICTARS